MQVRDNPAAEAWLSRGRVVINCHVCYENGPDQIWQTQSMNLRGAQREVTSLFRQAGYRPRGRWLTDIDGADSVRRFRKEGP